MMRSSRRKAKQDSSLPWQRHVSLLFGVAISWVLADLQGPLFFACPGATAQKHKDIPFAPPLPTGSIRRHMCPIPAAIGCATTRGSGPWAARGATHVGMRGSSSNRYLRKRWARCLTSSAVDLAEVRMESWLMHATETADFLQEMGRQHLRMEQELVLESGRRFQRDERLAIYKLFSRNCFEADPWKEGEADESLCTECRFEKENVTSTELGPLKAWTPHLLRDLTTSQCLEQAGVRKARCLFAVNQMKSETLFTPPPDDFDYCD
mmetsp:Transcript_25140/g.49231  ORF Transcript_25140/g.49231 Transcript_25140/m.49231 type:complete len:265 (-) Transcript_25140:47-841(-)